MGCQAVLSSVRPSRRRSASSCASDPAGIAHDALDGLRREHVEALGQLRVPARVDDRVEVAVRAQRGRELVAAAREQVDDAARHVGDGEHLAKVQAGQRPALRADRHDRVAGRQRGRDRPHQAEQLGLLGRDDADDSGRLGRREGQERRRDGVDAAEHRVQLVRPARVVHQHVHGGRHLVAGRGRLGPAQVDGLLGELGAARLERLRRAVEHLPAVVGGLAGPARLRLRGRP